MMVDGLISVRELVDRETVAKRKVLLRKPVTDG
jgi:hypothetical protein